MRRTVRGFTLIEGLVVIAILLISVLILAPILSDSVVKKDVQSASDQGVDALREAQSNVMTGKNNLAYGVHFEATKLVVFQGHTYSSGASTNVTTSLSGRLSITSVTLTGGACTVATGVGNCEVHFAVRRGIPTETGTIVFSDGGTITKTVTINAAGMIDVN